MEHPRITLAAISDHAVLADAWEHVRQKKAAGGVDGMTVDDFDRQAPDLLRALAVELQDGAYVPEARLRIQVPKASHPGERRPLGLASIRDKIVQQAVRSLLEPIAERHFLDCSYGYRPGKGPGRAVRRLSHHITSFHHAWASPADIDNCFGSLERGGVLAALSAFPVDAGVMRLFELWLAMGAVDSRGKWHESATGISQGDVLSPLFANIYLHPFDVRMRHGGHVHLRYADDFIVTAADRDGCAAGRDEAQRALDGLRLRLNHVPAPLVSLADGVTFLGVRFVGTARELDPAKLVSARRTLTEKLARVALGAPEPVLASVRDSVDGWRRYYGVVLEPDALRPLQEVVDEEVRRWVEGPGRPAGVATRARLRRALLDIEPLVPRDRNRWVTDLLRPRPRTAARGGASAKAVPSVASAVRTRRRQARRRYAATSHIVVNSVASFLGRSGDRLVVRRQGRRELEMPASRVRAITLASHGVSLSTDAVHLCAERGIPIVMLSAKGRVSALLTGGGTVPGAHATRQVEASQRAPLAFAARFVDGKIHNQFALLKCAAKYAGGCPPAFASALADGTGRLAQWRREVLEAAAETDPGRGRELLLGVEGRAAATYWQAWARLLPDGVVFEHRERKGARDLVNSLLNYGYAVLQARVHAAVLAAGLLPGVSFLHLPRRRNPTLVFDLMEEFRPVVVDRVVLTMLRRRETCEVGPDGWLTSPTRVRLLRRLHDRLAGEAPYRSERLPLGDIIDLQARALADAVGGGGPYKPYLARW